MSIKLLVQAQLRGRSALSPEGFLNVGVPCVDILALPAADRPTGMGRNPAREFGLGAHHTCLRRNIDIDQCFFFTIARRCCQAGYKNQFNHRDSPLISLSFVSRPSPGCVDLHILALLTPLCTLATFAVALSRQCRARSDLIICLQREANKRIPKVDTRYATKVWRPICNAGRQGEA